MKRLVILAVSVVLVLSLAGTALAEGGSIVPWGATRNVRAMEGGSIWPF